MESEISFHYNPGNVLLLPLYVVSPAYKIPCLSLSWFISLFCWRTSSSSFPREVHVIKNFGDLALLELSPTSTSMIYLTVFRNIEL